MLGGNHHFRLRREFWDPYITLMPVVFIHQLPFFEFFLAAMADLRGIILQCSSSTQPADILKDADPTLLVPGLHEGGAPQLKFGHVFLTGGFLQLGYPRIIQFKKVFHYKPSSYWGIPIYGNPPIWHFKSHIFRYAWMKCSLSSAFLWAGSTLDRWLGLVLREMRPMLFFLPGFQSTHPKPQPKWPVIMKRNFFSRTCFQYG